MPQLWVYHGQNSCGLLRKTAVVLAATINCLLLVQLMVGGGASPGVKGYREATSTGSAHEWPGGRGKRRREWHHAYQLQFAFSGRTDSQSIP